MERKTTKPRKPALGTAHPHMPHKPALGKPGKPKR